MRQKCYDVHFCSCIYGSPLWLELPTVGRQSAQCKQNKRANPVTFGSKHERIRSRHRVQGSSCSELVQTGNIKNLLTLKSSLVNTKIQPVTLETFLTIYFSTTKNDEVVIFQVRTLSLFETRAIQYIHQTQSCVTGCCYQPCTYKPDMTQVMAGLPSEPAPRSCLRCFSFILLQEHLLCTLRPDQKAAIISAELSINWWWSQLALQFVFLPIWLMATSSRILNHPGSNHISCIALLSKSLVSASRFPVGLNGDG